MGKHEGWSQPQPSDGPLPNGLLPNEAASVFRVLDSDQWLKAEERAAELIACIQPNPPSEERRNAVADYVQRLIMKCFPCQVFTFGSVPLKTYLPDGDIDLSAFSENQSLKDSWAQQVRDMLENEEKNENAEFRVKEVQCIQAEVKIIKCLVENIVVDISFDQLGGLCTLCFLEEVDNLISQNHLFKRSIILIKAWCYYESRILGAHHGLISTYALETLVLYIFHVFNNSFAGPLEVLYHFLEFFSKFDWDNFCVSLRGPVPISSLPDVTAEPPIKDGGELLLRKPFLDACTAVYAVFPNGQENQGRPFASKHFNVIDPLRINNNLGRSVSKGNFFRIRSAFAFGAKKLARLLDCPKEDLYHEVNQFFMNTWDRHGSGHRLDAVRNDLWRSRQSNADHLSETENLKNNLNSRKSDASSTRKSQGDGTQHAPSQSLINGNSYNARTSDQSTRDIGSKQVVHAGQGQRSYKPDNLVSDIQGRYLFGFARTHSSPELTDTYGEASSQGRCIRAPDGSKNQIAFATADDGMRKNVKSDSFPSHSIRSPTDDPSSVRRNSSHQSLDVAADSSSVSTSYNEDLGQGVMAEEFVNALGTQQMQLDEQDLVSMMASPTAHHYSGQMHVPLNSAPCHLPFPLPPSILASMGYTQRNFGGLVPPNIPLIESSLQTNEQFPPGFVPSQLTNYFPGIGLASNPEDSTESGNETYNSVEMNRGEGDRDFWHVQENGSTGGFDLDNGNFEMHQSDDKQHSTSASYDFVPSSQLDNSGNSQWKIIGETRGSMREEYPDDFQHADNRGNEIYFNDRTVSSRSFANVHSSSTRSKTSSESSWEGSSVKVSKSRRERRGRRPTANDLQSVVYGIGKSVSEHSSPYGEDETREWNAQLTIGSEMAERNAGPQSVSSLNVPRGQISEFGKAQTSGSDSVIPIAPMLLGPSSHQRTMDNSGGFPFAFYPTGPPVPFVTMLPLYNFPSETSTSDASKSHFDGEEGLDHSDSRNNFDSSEGIDQPEVVSPSSSIGVAASVELSEHKPDILNSDFASHWQNLQYGRFCQNSHSPVPSIYPSPVVVPPVYLQGRFPWDGPGRPVSSNMNLFTQLMNYGPRLVPVPPLQPVFNRPAGVYQRYGDEMPRHRSGTGTYLPNPKMSVRERYSSNARRGNYSYERSEHHSDKEGSWNTNLKSRPAGRTQNRNQAEKPSLRPERLTSEGRPDRSWASHRHETHSSYQSQTSPIRPNSHSGSANVAYGMYPLPGMNPGTVSSNGSTIPSVVMLYPWDHNAGYGSSAEQLEFGSFGPVGFSSVNEVSQLSEANRLGGAYEERRFRGSSAERSSPDQSSSPHPQRGI